MAGLWNGVQFSVPTQVAVVNSTIVGASDFGAMTVQGTFETNGTFASADGTGTFSIGAQGVVTIYPPSGQPVAGRVNAPQDVFVGLSTGDQGREQRLILVAKAPDTLSNSDLAGTWSLMTFDTPEQLIEVTSGTNGAVTDLLGISSNSVSGTPLARIASGAITFNTDGTLSGSLQGSFTGTYALGASGQVNLNIGTLTPTAFVNSTKNLMFGLNVQSSDNRQEVILMAKQPASGSLSGLEGAWKITTINVPEQLTLTTDPSGDIIGIDSSGSFSADQMAFTAGDDGFLTGVFDGHPSTGALSMGTGGATAVTFTNSSGSESHTAFANAGMNAAATVESDGIHFSLTVLVQAPAVPGDLQDFGLLPLGNTVFWAGGTNRVLQASGQLGGAWTNVASTQDQHEYPLHGTNGAEFYRVAQQP